MTNKQLIFGGMALASAITVAGIAAYVSTVRYERDAEINKQTEIEKTRIKEEIKLKRTKERMQMIPWYDETKGK